MRTIAKLLKTWYELKELVGLYRSNTRQRGLTLREWDRLHTLERKLGVKNTV